MTRLVLLSDTHLRTKDLVVPDGDILVHCGDGTMTGTTEEFERFGEWLRHQPHEDKVVTWGNHDLGAEENPQEAEAILRRWDVTDDIHVLNNSGAVVQGLKFWGVPYSTPFGGWAFMPPEAKARVLYEAIPTGLDVLISHGPPLGIGDRLARPPNQRVGSKALTDRLWQTFPRVVAFGHIHEGYGSYLNHWLETAFYNCAVLNERYELVNAPIVVDL